MTRETIKVIIDRRVDNLLKENQELIEVINKLSSLKRAFDELALEENISNRKVEMIEIYSNYIEEKVENLENFDNWLKGRNETV